MGYLNVFWHDLLGREYCRRAETLQVRIKKQGDWALKCTSGHDLERRFIDTINDDFFEQLFLVPMWEDITPDLGLCSAVLTLQVGLLGCPSGQRTVGCCKHMCLRDVGHTRSSAWHPLSFQSLCSLLRPLLLLVCGVHTLGSTRSLPSASVPHAETGASQRQPCSSAALALPCLGSMRACGPSSDQAKAVKPPGRFIYTPRKKLFCRGEM